MRLFIALLRTQSGGISSAAAQLMPPIPRGRWDVPAPALTSGHNLVWAVTMLVELGLVEQRHWAVLEVLAGATVTDVVRRFGVMRKTVLHTWLRRYASAGMARLVL